MAPTWKENENLRHGRAPLAYHICTTERRSERNNDMKYRVTVLFDNYRLLLPVGSFIVLTQSTITDLPYARQSTRGYRQTIKPSIRVLRYETASFSFPLFLNHLTKLSVLLHTHTYVK